MGTALSATARIVAIITAVCALPVSASLAQDIDQDELRRAEQQSRQQRDGERPQRDGEQRPTPLIGGPPADAAPPPDQAAPGQPPQQRRGGRGGTFNTDDSNAGAADPGRDTRRPDRRPDGGQRSERRGRPDQGGDRGPDGQGDNARDHDQNPNWNRGDNDERGRGDNHRNQRDRNQDRGRDRDNDRRGGGDWNRDRDRNWDRDRDHDWDRDRRNWTRDRRFERHRQYRPPVVIIRPYTPFYDYGIPPYDVYRRWWGPVTGEVIWDPFDDDVYDALPARAREAHERAFSEALAEGDGGWERWRMGGASGEVRIVDSHFYGRAYCLDFVESIAGPGWRRTVDGRACIRPGRAWELVAY